MKTQIIAPSTLTPEDAVYIANTILDMESEQRQEQPHYDRDRYLGAIAKFLDSQTPLRVLDSNRAQVEDWIVQFKAEWFGKEVIRIRNCRSDCDKRYLYFAGKFREALQAASNKWFGFACVAGVHTTPLEWGSERETLLLNAHNCVIARVFVEQGKIGQKSL
ncbi:hypothetical protein [Thermoleptolyngbya sp. M55_K2018_002]|uniref:hypothetical protein n=1 Tax=Thermoleptolyngbya sp. M55_K2018_002 TaxID=2747808 RepID=UPI0019EF21FB|nr:hypothetical protein [Thermoleptolyngbya sp. M55_K2018_002]HIK39768.1 hypothetical protein [Thermoleptolyngbya sp. M55_K2018_002]